MHLVQADAVDWLARGPTAADAIHLDPMYPHEDKAALPQKSMQMLRELTGGDADAVRLLEAALGADVRRVAVKRPISGSSLGARTPELQMRGTQARYDVYLTPGAPAAGAARCN
jgi:16S rRNA (guanine1516-N2)-methyltransferase